MTDTEKVTFVKALVSNDAMPAEITDELVSVYLALAKDKIIDRLYPWGVFAEDVDFPARYDTLQCELASRLILRRGAEGEITHTERNTNRQYASASDDDLLRQVIPYAKVVG